MGDSHRPVRYEHETCNVENGAVHLLVSTERRLKAAIQMVACVDTEGIAQLDRAMAQDNIYRVMACYADCAGKLENALLVLNANRTVYNEILQEFVTDAIAKADALKITLDSMAQSYHWDVRSRLTER
jgi:hypothetical protein